VATRKIWETELQAVQARLESATEELADKQIHLAQERRRSLQLEIAERDIRGFMNDLQSKLQTVKQNDEAAKVDLENTRQQMVGEWEKQKNEDRN